MATTTTTTAAPQKQQESKIDLRAFLEYKGLSRAENYYYYQHNIAQADEQKTVTDWEESIKLVEKN